jgi:hypothetical protein
MESTWNTETYYDGGRKIIKLYFRDGRYFGEPRMDGLYKGLMDYVSSDNLFLDFEGTTSVNSSFLGVVIDLDHKIRKGRISKSDSEELEKVVSLLNVSNDVYELIHHVGLDKRLDVQRV